MEEMRDIFRRTGGLHHAYLVEGGDEAQAAILGFLEEDFGVRTRGNPDFWHGRFETFGIDDGRTLSEMQGKMSAAGGRKVFVVEAGFITHEAQNSLLKVFEEPTSGTHFFILMPSAERLLPTLLSRLQVVRMKAGGAEADGGTARRFLAMGPAARADALKAMIDDKDRAQAAAFLGALEAALRSRLDLVHASAEETFALAELEKARDYMNDRSPSIKMLLEHAANVVPRY